MAHHRQPLVYIGKAGLSERVVEEIETALHHHELIKVKFQDFKDEKKALAAQIVTTTGCGLVGMIGNVAILYRESLDPELRAIEL